MLELPCNHQIETCPPHQLYVFVVMDEMHVKEDLIYNKHSGDLVGFMNLEDMNTHLIEQQKRVKVKKSDHWPRQET